ncbi:MAG: hypothetical protein ACLPX5_07255 [Dissulfurispiraceae bacterium]
MAALSLLLYALSPLVHLVTLVAEDALVDRKHGCWPTVVSSLGLCGGPAHCLLWICSRIGPERSAGAVINGNELITEAESQYAVKTGCMGPVTRETHDAVTVRGSIRLAHVSVHGCDGGVVIVLERHEGKVRARNGAAHIARLLVFIVSVRHVGGDLLVGRVDDGAKRGVILGIMLGILVIVIVFLMVVKPGLWA